MKEQAIKYFENEITQFEIMLNGILNKEYEEYISYKKEYYKLALESLKK